METCMEVIGERITKGRVSAEIGVILTWCMRKTDDCLSLFEIEVITILYSKLLVKIT